MKIRDEAFKYYFYFISERMNIFWRRFYNTPINGEPQQLLNTDVWSEDKIFQQYKFTNVYRVLDRVSQYLVKNVIYNKEYDHTNTIFRILLFKVFNKIETWQFLENTFGDIVIENYHVDRYSDALSKRILKTPIFSPAYIMTGSHKDYSYYKRKHEKWLHIINDHFIKNKKISQILLANSLEEIYNILLNTPLIGEFLAYQYAIDFNYSDSINFDENSFVKAGIGAIRGIKKCFEKTSNYSYEYFIEYTQDNFESLQYKYQYTNFKNLFGRNPTLIDLQNCFCETDKYLRVKMPEISLGNVRIKQKYTQTMGSDINYIFPPKWHLNI